MGSSDCGASSFGPELDPMYSWVCAFLVFVWVPHNQLAHALREGVPSGVTKHGEDKRHPKFFLKNPFLN